MSKVSLFLDSSALFAGVVSSVGAARVLLLLAEAGVVTAVVSEQVIAETERALARKAPAALPAYRQFLLSVGVRIVRDPPSEAVAAHQGWLPHPGDVPILVAAMQSGAHYLVPLNRRHFLDDPNLGARAGLLLGTPGDALAWLREQWAQKADS